MPGLIIKVKSTIRDISCTSVTNDRLAGDFRIEKNVLGVGDLRREAPNDGSFWPCLKPVPRVRGTPILIAWTQVDLVPNGAVGPTVTRWVPFWVRSWFPRHIKVSLSPLPSKDLLFTGIVLGG
jgi:hypothetical protein